MEVDPLSEQELDRIEARCEAATPGPWYARSTDDQVFMNALFVGTRPGEMGVDGLYHDDGRGLAAGGKEQAPPEQIIAITLLQSPHLADVKDELWDENTLFIAYARSDIPRLIGEVRRLRARLNGM